MQAVWAGGIGANRLPTDPLFFADLTLRNIVAGSRYRITRSDTGAELATGVASGSGLVDVVVSGVSCFSNPQLVTVVVRKASEAPKYVPYEAQTEISKSGGLAFIAQIPDPIA
jgi:hypothetical protein